MLYYYNYDDFGRPSGDQAFDMILRHHLNELIVSFQKINCADANSVCANTPGMQLYLYV